jgi:hypothetical protein
MVGKAPVVSALKDLRLSVAAGEFGLRQEDVAEYCRGVEREDEGQVSSPDSNEHGPHIG